MHNKKKNIKRWIVYLLRCADNSYYYGITTDLDNRLVAHNWGKGAKYTRSRYLSELYASVPNCAIRVAIGSNLVWSWDITKLKAATMWTYFYLKVIIGIFSRYMVDWMVTGSE